MQKPLSKNEIAIYKQRLLDLLASLSGEVEAVEEQSLGTSSEPPFHREDDAVEETALDEDLQVIAAEDELGYEAHEALERIANGTYGICETCGEPITRERLDLLPYARECARDAALRAKR